MFTNKNLKQIVNACVSLRWHIAAIFIWNGRYGSVIIKVYCPHVFPWRFSFSWQCSTSKNGNERLQFVNKVILRMHTNWGPKISFRKSLNLNFYCVKLWIDQVNWVTLPNDCFPSCVKYTRGKNCLEWNAFLFNMHSIHSIKSI